MNRMLLLLVISSISMNAQKNFKRDADKAYTAHEYFSSLELYKIALTKTDKKQEKAEVIFRIAECYRMLNDYKQQEIWYAKTVKINYPNPLTILYLANAKKILGKYEEALEQFNAYKKEVPDDQRGENGIKSCELAQQWKDNPARYTIENMVQINSKELDFSPCYSDKKSNSIYFTSTRAGVTGDAIDGGYGQHFSDLFETKVDRNGKWSTPIPVQDPVNTSANDGAGVVSKKGDMMIFTRCKNEKNKKYKCGLYITIKRGQTWSEPELIPFCTDSAMFRHPALSADEQVLVFSSDMPGGFGGNDLWASVWNKSTKEWSSPFNLGAEINTNENEAFPYISEEGTLYFSSDGHLGMGGLDIFKAEKKADSKWNNVINMQCPFNSPSDDFGIIIDGKKNRGYLSSNREGGKGADDIYAFYAMQNICIIKGRIINCKTKTEMLEGVGVKLLGSDGTVAETKTDKDGNYIFSENGNKRFVNDNTSYVISTFLPDGGKNIQTATAKWGFMNSPVKVKETTVGITTSTTFTHDFCLEPLPPPMVDIRFGDVLYEYDRADLTSQSKDTLDVLYNILIDNPGFVIELNSHTDFRGDEAYNLRLSNARAKSCVDYLISKGINKDRLVAKGFGESKPLEVFNPSTGKVLYALTQKYIMNLNAADQEDAHHKNRRTVFRILRKDFAGPATS